MEEPGCLAEASDVWVRLFKSREPWASRKGSNVPVRTSYGIFCSFVPISEEDIEDVIRSKSGVPP
jgi:hypothetical protein